MSAALIYGELLFDQFPSGETVLGGAPMNVAWHLHALGVPVTMISRVGDDALGRQVLDTLHQAGISTREIQIDPEHATGTVQIELEQGTPRFDIVDDVAYDHIAPPSAAALAQPYQLLYHGSLALRNPASRATLDYIRTQTACPIFVDINLRPPFWSKASVKQLISQASWVKLNHEELALLTDKPVSDQRSAIVDLARGYRASQSLTALIVTCGAAGAFIVTEHDCYDMSPVKPEKFVDTVGAGDAFSAIAIAGLLHDWDYQQILEQASRFAARICGIRGAIPDKTFQYPDLKHV